MLYQLAPMGLFYRLLALLSHLLQGPDEGCISSSTLQAKLHPLKLLLLNLYSPLNAVFELFQAEDISP